MSSRNFTISPTQVIAWIVMAVGVLVAFKVGGMIADGDYNGVVLSMVGVVLLIVVLTLREYWWSLPYLSLGIGFSSSALGFNFTGTDLMTLCAFACLIALATMGRLHQRSSHSNLGVFYLLILAYVGVHAFLFGMDNYFYGNTQFKNIAKSYYGALFPLILIGLMDRFALMNSAKKIIDLQILLSIILTLFAIVIVVTKSTIPVLSIADFNFSWANEETAQAFLRWTMLPVAMLSICLIPSARSAAWKNFYRMTALVLVLATFFGGGRGSAFMMILFVLMILVIRKKWKELVLWGWIIIVVGGGLLIAGHTMNLSASLLKLPDFLQPVQRALSIFLPSSEADVGVIDVQGSNKWHNDLINVAWDYTNENLNKMIFGNGFKGWDDSIDVNTMGFGDQYDSAVKMAVHMGSSETFFFSVLPIFGWVGVILYYGFMIEIMSSNLRLMRICPEGTLAKSLCEFSFCLIFTLLLVSPLAGSIPSYNIIYWVMGFIIAETYLQKSVKSSLLQ